MPINQTINSPMRYQPKITMEAQPLPDSSMNDTVNQSKDSEDSKPGSLPHITIPGSNQDSDSSPTASISPGIATRALGPCAECGLRINQLSDACHALGYLYHNACFVCCYCQRTLSGKVFYKDQEKIYCEEDYLYCGFQQVAEKCCVCGHLISERFEKFCSLSTCRADMQEFNQTSPHRCYAVSVKEENDVLFLRSPSMEQGQPPS